MFNRSAEILGKIASQSPDRARSMDVTRGVQIVTPGRAQDFAEMFMNLQHRALTDRELNYTNEPGDRHVRVGHYAFSWEPHYRRGSAIALRKADFADRDPDKRIVPSFLKQDMQTSLYMADNPLKVGDVNRSFAYIEPGVFPDNPGGFRQSVSLSPAIGLSPFGEFALERSVRADAGEQIIGTFNILTGLSDTPRVLAESKQLKKFGDRIRIILVNGKMYAMAEPQLDGSKTKLPKEIDSEILRVVGIDVQFDQIPGMTRMLIEYAGQTVDLQFAHGAKYTYKQDLFTPLPEPVFESTVDIWGSSGSIISDDHLSQHWA